RRAAGRVPALLGRAGPGAAAAVHGHRPGRRRHHRPAAGRPPSLMLGRGLIRKAAAVAAMAAAMAVAVVALGYATYFLLATVMVPAAAAAITALVFAAIAVLIGWLAFRV